MTLAGVMEKTGIGQTPNRGLDNPWLFSSYAHFKITARKESVLIHVHFSRHIGK